MKKLTHYTTLSLLAIFLLCQSNQLVAQGVEFTKIETEKKFKQLLPKKLDQVNSDIEESMPVITADDQQLYFMRTQVASKKKVSKFGQEIWVANREGNTWGAPQKEQLNINDLANNAVIGASADGNTIYLFNSVETRHKLAKGLAFISKDSTGKWGEIKKLNIPGFEIGDGYYAFYVTPDENTLLVSAALDTMAYEDIYVSEKIDGTWSALKSLGTTVNTSEIETSPFITADKKTLYFSSAGHGGYGETDLFKSTRTGAGWDQWSTPVNLGDKINSSAFDAYLVVSSDEKTAYFSSNRGGNYSDIYYVADFDRQENKLLTLSFQGIKMSEKSIEVFGKDGNLIKVITTDENGGFKYESLEAEYYMIDGIKVYKDEMLNFIYEKQVVTDLKPVVFNIADESLDSINPTNDVEGYYQQAIVGVVKSNIESTKIQKDDVTTMSFSAVEAELLEEYIIYFDFDQFIIKPEEKIKLDELIALSKHKGQLQVKLIGHTDYVGPQRYNLALSDKRVKAVNDYLESNGQKLSVINTEAIGELKPAANNSTIIGRAKNRRVEIKVYQ